MSRVFNFSAGPAALPQDVLEKAQAEMKLASRKLDKAAKDNVIHKNQAARRKSRLQKAVDKI